MPKSSFSVSVRDLIEFVLRSGDLAGSGNFVGPGRALEGTRGHQRIQKSRPKHFRSEVSVSHRIEIPELILTIKGRIDGILEAEGSVVIEEIKTRFGASPDADPLHWAQAKVYAAIYLLENPADTIQIQITNVDLESGELTLHRQGFSAIDLKGFLEELTGVYLEWLKEHVRWCENRNASIASLPFPFSKYRKGQRELAVAVYRSLSREGKLFAEAPTGIGKTISVLYPALKAMNEGRFSKIFYLTAKTIGRSVAEKALDDLRQAGIHFRAVTLTAKEKICFNNGQTCDVRTCPFAIGYYDRVKAAIKDALDQEALSRPVLEAVARRHQVCPFELSLDVSVWADAIICDYNYVFDPRVYLKRYFSDESNDYAFLIDEAHNLLDRAREMFSADLTRSEIVDVAHLVRAELPKCAKTLAKVNRHFVAWRKQSQSEETGEATNAIISREIPADFVKSLGCFLEEAESWLTQNKPAEFREALLELYFRVTSFIRTAELYDERYVTIIDIANSEGRVRLFCIDPSFLLRQAIDRGKAAVFFSATLTPIDYYREILGGGDDDATLRLSSPFDPANLKLLVEDSIATNLRQRELTYDEVTHSIAATVRPRGGNYLVYFPSYKYLNRIAETFRAYYPEIDILLQSPGMSENDREAFLLAFQSDRPQTLVGFAVMGGIFGEGIDLVGDRLVGAVVVGVGLPQICLERNLICEYFQERKGTGFDYAYAYPGMNRVLQAVGRVIRSETDLGVALLIDSRFGQTRYLDLFPSWWNAVTTRNAKAISREVSNFWNSGC